jgi:aminoglycoside phosphotransferase (APT) family kinase protein
MGVTGPDWLAVLGPVERAVLLPGGASKEAWAVDVGGEELLLRRALTGVIHCFTLSLEQEFRVLQVAHDSGVKVPRPIAYYADLGGREAFTMERVRGETIGRRIVRNPPPGLPEQLAEELAKIHAIPPERLDFLRGGDPVANMREELDSVEEPHPAIELGLAWVDERLRRDRAPVVTHGDWRIGNVVVSERGLEYVLDWEFARLSDPADDVSWPLVRAWRFGADDRHLGGVGEVEPYRERYNELTGRDVTLEELAVWEVLGNAKWATGCLTQSRRHLRGQDRSVEYAVLGRMAAEMEYELLDLIERHDSPLRRRSRRLRSLAGSLEPTPADRPTAQELAEAVREFLEHEILPVLDDARLRFRTLVAMNALGMVERETVTPPEEREADRELARRIRAGEVGVEALPQLREAVAAKLRISNPAYLERY